MSVASGTLGDGQDLHAPAPADGIRPVRRGDEAAILEFLLRALDRGELDGVTRHFLEESIERLGAVTHGSAVAVDGDRIVGWVMPQDDLLVVDPDARRRGHGTRLVAAGQVIAARAGRSHLRLWVPRRDGPETFAHVNGLHYHSSLWQMRLPPDVPVDRPRLPDDLVARALVPGVDEPALVDLVNTAFRDHPSPFTLDLAHVRRVDAHPDFDPSTTLVMAPADELDRLIAFCRVARYADDEGRPIGEIKLLGVLPAFRNRGLGRELVRWGVGAVRARGAGDVFLSVEGRNDGALRLYLALGFDRHIEWPHWTIAAGLPEEGARLGDT